MDFPTNTQCLCPVGELPRNKKTLEKGVKQNLGDFTFYACYVSNSFNLNLL